jgi:hypothetical protein
MQEHMDLRKKLEFISPSCKKLQANYPLLLNIIGNEISYLIGKI